MSGLACNAVLSTRDLDARLRSECERLIEAFNRDMPNRAAQVGYQAGVNDVLRAAVRIAVELSR